MRKRERPHVVTGAAESREAEHKFRQRRYMLTMSARLLLLIIAAIVARWSIPAGIAIGALSAVLPGFAVVMANDGPPKKRVQRAVVPHPAPERALTAAAEPGMGPRIITADSVIIDENGATLRSKK